MVSHRMTRHGSSRHCLKNVRALSLSQTSESFSHIAALPRKRDAVFILPLHDHR